MVPNGNGDGDVLRPARVIRGWEEQPDEQPDVVKGMLGLDL